jgi:tetratricopeptide (TPR) repeat protein
VRKKIIFLLTAVLLIPALVLGATLIITNKPLSKQDAEFYYITGNAFFKEGAYARAITSYEQAVQLKPLHIEARQNLAFLYNKLGDYDLAAAHLAELVKINPANPSYHYDYAINLVLNIQKTNQGTIEDIETALNEFSIAEQLVPGYAHSKENIDFLNTLRKEYYEQKQQ